jgi:uncharacterized protein (TIGR02001 family)
MFNSLKTAFAVILLAGMPAMATAGISAGADSDYLFRGVSQTDGGSSAWAGYDHMFGDSGFMVGAWLGQVDYADGSDLETDLYAGWSNGDWAVGYIDYSYNGDADLDGGEIFVSKSVMGVSVEYYMGQDDYTDYLELGYSVMGVDVSYGMWEDIGDNWSVSKAFDLPMGLEGSLSYVSFMADDGSMMEDEDSLVFGLSKSF